MTCAEFRMTLTFAQVSRLIAAGFLPADPECPDELREAMTALLATLPAVPPITVPERELRAA